MGSGRSTPAPGDDNDDDEDGGGSEGDVVEEPASFSGAGSRSDGARSDIPADVMRTRSDLSPFACSAARSNEQLHGLPLRLHVLQGPLRLRKGVRRPRSAIQDAATTAGHRRCRRCPPTMDDVIIYKCPASYDVTRLARPSAARPLLPLLVRLREVDLARAARGPVAHAAGAWNACCGWTRGGRGTAACTVKAARMEAVPRRNPAEFLKQIVGKPVTVRLTSGVDYQGNVGAAAAAC